MDTLIIQKCPNCLKDKTITFFDVDSLLCRDCLCFENKKCTSCNKIKSFDQFAYDKYNTKRGYRLNICKECFNVYLQNKRRDRVKTLVCYRCEGKLLQHSKSLCETCWYKVQSSKVYHTEKQWKELKLLLEKQNYLCPHTGERLIPGHNMVLFYDINNKLSWISKTYKKSMT